jgi:hypothetical protein
MNKKESNLVFSISPFELIDKFYISFTIIPLQEGMEKKIVDKKNYPPNLILEPHFNEEEPKELDLFCREFWSDGTNFFLLTNLLMY